jgi:putative peptidoglycan lipid II flippase
MLAMSAWCLGILNSHHKFLLSYASGVVWNIAMIATLIVFGAGTALPRLAVVLAWGSVVGSALQFLVQLPVVLQVAPDLHLAIDVTSAHVRSFGRNFLPVVISRGVNQVSSYVDQVIASWLSTGAVTGLQNASTLYTLPVSLFGMSVSAAELPTMSGIASADPASIEAVRVRLDAGLRRIAFFVVPSAVAFLALGDVVVGALFQTDRFNHSDSIYVWRILAGSSVGLLASTLGRLYSSTYYAFRDTQTPLRYAAIRVALTTVLVIGLSMLTSRVRWRRAWIAVIVVCAYWNVALTAEFATQLMDRQKLEPAKNAYDAFVLQTVVGMQDVVPRGLMAERRPRDADVVHDGRAADFAFGQRHEFDL